MCAKLYAKLHKMLQIQVNFTEESFHISDTIQAVTESSQLLKFNWKGYTEKTTV